ncbi:hypothetical protein GALMADRAFT_243190 [Galerina marginata CBS 339.88]|uniref:Origin recognition complex subunit 5 n=1 Tax=Galerina marginata (strain CBS 339.88) TaxID=685588 RepID=A0A067T7T3_GALM3|nr:hypothetical protein GALMADRAFT_243190 [Galerina marginata CBS 339.88]
MDDIACPFPGYEGFTYELASLISTYPPPFIYIQDTQTFRTTLNVVDAILRDLSVAPPSTSPCKVYYAQADSIACFTSRLFYEAIINTLVGWQPKWEDGCENWTADGVVEGRWNDSMDSFLHGLRAVHAHLCRQSGISPSAASSSSTSKGKGKQKEGGHENVRLVIVVERVERLKDSLPELLVPLTRLAELARLDLSVIFISQMGWENIRPPLGASPDPYYIDIQAPSKENIIQSLIGNFSNLCTQTQSTSTQKGALSPYHPALHTLYAHFVKVLCDVCFPFTHDPQELQYIAAARWPGFCKPLIDEHAKKLAEYRRRRRRRKGRTTVDELFEENDDDGDVEMDDVDDDRGRSEEGDDDTPAPDDDDDTTADLEFLPPSEDVRMRLNRLFNPTLTNALEALLPRLTNAADWAAANEPPPDLDLLSLPRNYALPVHSHGQQPTQAAAISDDADMKALPRISKFILLASYLASTNPAKSDMRMFGRGLDEKKRKRRATKGGGKTRGGGPAKVSQRLLGPTAFPLDRMNAILGALLEENDAETRLYAREFSIPGEQTDMEIGRVGVYASVMELTAMRLLHRTSPADRLDGPPQFKCAISYDAALALARELKVALNDLLWDPV